MLNKIAGGIDRSFNGEVRPKKVGFALLLFEFGKVEAGRMNWISNADRRDMIVALKEMVAQLEGRAGPAGRA
ncbi:hypothetical protein [Chelativorans sp.]|uniref:hypothetical protein n=1 Tax=Chelativorans sp. TaxID=2203393 RepID=UPI0028111A36|nr:hypothetical protein [Chelativorans sp.]